MSTGGKIIFRFKGARGLLPGIFGFRSPLGNNVFEMPSWTYARGKHMKLVSSTFHRFYFVWGSPYKISWDVWNLSTFHFSTSKQYESINTKMGQTTAGHLERAKASIGEKARIWARNIEGGRTRNIIFDMFLLGKIRNNWVTDSSCIRISSKF